MSEVKIFDEIIKLVDGNTESIKISDLFDPRKIKDIKSCEIRLENISMVESNPVVRTVSMLFKKKNISDRDADELIDSVAKAIAEYIKDDTIASKIRSVKDKLKKYLADDGYNGFINRLKMLVEINRILRGNKKAIKLRKFLLDRESLYSIDRTVRVLYSVDCKTLALLTEVYLELIERNYKLFDYAEWFLVLANMWSKCAGGLIHICPACNEPYAIYYLYVYKCGNKCYESLSISDFVKTILDMINIRL